MKSKTKLFSIILCLSFILSINNVSLFADQASEAEDITDIDMVADLEDSVLYYNYDIELESESEYYVESPSDNASSFSAIYSDSNNDIEYKDGAYSTSGYSPKNDSEEDIAPFTIFGNDDRRRVTNTASDPYAAIVYLSVSWPDGYTTSGTGFMYGKDVLITAGHCVYDQSRGGYAKQVFVSPGRNESSFPYAGTTSKNIYVPSPWTKYEDSNYDYAAVRLNDSIGYNTGWFGATWYDSLPNLNATITGYLKDKGNSTNKGTQMWTAGGTISASGSYRLRTQIDMVEGNSGGPIYRLNNNIGDVLGIVSEEAPSNNYGVRITENIFTFINSFR